MKKFEKEYTVRNWVHFVISTNNFNAITIPPDDRRFLIPDVIEYKHERGQEYWQEFNRWLTRLRGLEKIAGWAMVYGDYFREGDEAPETKLMQSIVVMSASEGQKFAHSLLCKLRVYYDKEKFYLTDKTLQILVRENGFDRVPESLATLRRMVKPAELYISARNNGLKEWGFVKDEVRIISNDEKVQGLASLEKIRELSYFAEDGTRKPLDKESIKQKLDLIVEDSI